MKTVDTAPGEPRVSRYVWTEFTLLFVVLPVLYATDLVYVPKVIPLVALFLYCLSILFIQRRNSMAWLTCRPAGSLS